MAERKAKPKPKDGTRKKINPPSPAMKSEASDALKGIGTPREDEGLGGRVLGEGAREPAAKKPVPKKALPKAKVPAKRAKP
jgi:hypothetical protein